MFGFFYAWICSTMWGLDAADPNVAISAMQAMNASVRNPVFALGFLRHAAPPRSRCVGCVEWGKNAAPRFSSASSSLLYVLGIMVPTSMTNVPLNETLAVVEVPLAAARAQEVWQSYSTPWQFWNTIRAVAAGVSLLLTGLAVLSLGRSGSPGPGPGPFLPSSPNFR